jgi:hypothetical protein
MAAQQSKGTIHFFLGIVIDTDDPRKRAPQSAKAAPVAATPMGVRLIPLVLGAQQPDLQTLCEDFADIAMKMDESAKIAQSEVEVDAAPPPKEQAVDPAKGKKKPPTKVVKAADVPEVGPLHRQAEALAKRAEIQWGVAVSKTELVISKSNRMLAGLMNQKDRWPPEVKLGGVDVGSAGSLARFFNADYGICEKAQQIGDWFASSSSVMQESSTPTTAKA